MTAAPAALAGQGDLLRTAVREHLGAAGGRLVVVAMSRDENPKATVLAFPPGAASPRLAIKVALSAGARSSVAAEAGALRRLAECDPDLVGTTAPRLLGDHHDDGGAVMVTTAQPGVPMAVDYHRWRHTARPVAVHDDFRCAGRWLDALAAVPAPEEPWTYAAGPARARAVTGTSVAEALVARWPASASARLLADRVASGVALLSDGRPSSVVHGDFWCGNVLRRGGAVTGVIDWEHASFADEPLRDRARFALSYALYLDRHTPPGRRVTGHPALVAGRWGEGVRYAFSGRGWFPSLVRTFVSDGLRATGRDPGLWREVLLAGLAEIAATSDHELFARQHLGLASSLAGRDLSDHLRDDLRDDRPEQGPRP